MSTFGQEKFWDHFLVRRPAALLLLSRSELPQTIAPSDELLLALQDGPREEETPTTRLPLPQLMGGGSSHASGWGTSFRRSKQTDED